MTYSTSAPPVCVVSALNANSPNIWWYTSTDGASTVDASGYITNGYHLGMRVNDIVFVCDSDASPVTYTTHRVVSVSATTGAVDLSNGDTLVTGTNSD